MDNVELMYKFRYLMDNEFECWDHADFCISDYHDNLLICLGDSIDISNMSDKEIEEYIIDSIRLFKEV
jgi:hypothetical protein